MAKGWRGEPYRHKLARMGIKTKARKTPTLPRDVKEWNKFRARTTIKKKGRKYVLVIDDVEVASSKHKGNLIEERRDLFRTEQRLKKQKVKK